MGIAEREFTSLEQPSHLLIHSPSLIGLILDLCGGNSMIQSWLSPWRKKQKAFFSALDFMLLL